MIPWLLVAEIVSHTGKPLSELVAAAMRRFPRAERSTARSQTAKAVIAKIRERYAASALLVDETDGVGMDFPQWRFNLRMSNTELPDPVERRVPRRRAALMKSRTDELLSVIGGE